MMMDGLGNNLYMNRPGGIDAGKGDMRRISEPSMKFYTAEKHSAARPTARAVSGKAGGNASGYSGNRAVTSGISGAAPGDNSSGKTRASIANDASGKPGLYPRADEADGIDMPGGAQASGSGRKKANSDKTGFRLDFSEKGLLNGIIMSEILGKPKFLRKGRW